MPPRSVNDDRPASQDDADVKDLLLQITRDLVGTTNLDALLQKIADSALAVVPRASNFVIHLLSDSGNWLTPKVSCAPCSTRRASDGFSAKIGLAGQAIAEKRVVSVGDVLAHPGSFVPLRSGKDLRSLMVAPLLYEDKVLGTLSLSCDTPLAFRTCDQQYAGTLAAQAAVALQQARLYQAAVQERERSDAIIASMSDGLAILSPEDQLTRINLKLLELLECPRDFVDRLPLKRDQIDCEALRFLLDSDPGDAIEVTLPSGTARAVSLSTLPMRPPSTGRIVIVRDVTAQRQESLERATFMSLISHELRTPLQHILSFVSLINDIDDLAPEVEQTYLDNIEEETFRLARLVDDLLELSRLETGRFSIYKEHVRLDDLMATTIERLAPRAQLAGLNLVLQNAAQPLIVDTDALRVEQVLVNLIENALKYVPTGGDISVRLASSPEFATLHVADTGPGIPQDELERIFESFYRADTTASRSPGVGLGLYISKQIVESLGGTIWVESSPGKGSCFSFSLPL